MKSIILSQAITHTTDEGKILQLKAGANQVDDDVADHWFVKHYMVDAAINTEANSKTIKQVEDLETNVSQLKTENESLAEALKASETKVADLEKQLAEALKAIATAAPKAEK